MEIFDLKRFRRDNRLTQTQIANLFGCKQSYISDIERFRRPMPEAYMKILLDRFNAEEVKTYYIEHSIQNPNLVYPHAGHITNGNKMYNIQILQEVNEKIDEYKTLLSEANLKISTLNTELSETKNALIEAKNQIIILQAELLKKS